jgi:hypothetical protein
MPLQRGGASSSRSLRIYRGSLCLGDLERLRFLLTLQGILGIDQVQLRLEHAGGSVLGSGRQYIASLRTARCLWETVNPLVAVDIHAADGGSSYPC